MITDKWTSFINILLLTGCNRHDKQNNVHLPSFLVEDKILCNKDVFVTNLRGIFIVMA